MTSYINKSHFGANSAGRHGGGVLLKTDTFQGVSEFHSCTFRLSNAGHDGGAFSTAGNVYVKLVSTEFSDNQAEENGGAIAQVGSGDNPWTNLMSPLSQVQLESCTLTANAAGKDGGAIWVKKAQMKISACRLLDNTAARYGGAVLGLGAGITLSESFVWGNNGSVVCTSPRCTEVHKEQERGAAVCATATTHMYIDSSFFAANTNALWVSASTLVMRLTNLSAAVGEAGISANKSDVLIDSSDIKAPLVFTGAGKHFLVLGGSHVVKLNAPLSWSPEAICLSYTACDEPASQLRPFVPLLFQLFVVYLFWFVVNTNRQKQRPRSIPYSVSCKTETPCLFPEILATAFRQRFVTQRLSLA